MMRVHEKYKSFYHQLMAIADELDLIIIVDRMYVIDRKTNESTTAQILPREKSHAQTLT